MNTQTQAYTGTLVLAEFDDPRRAVATDQMLGPEEARRLTERGAHDNGIVIEVAARRMLVFFPRPASALEFSRTVQQLMSQVRSMQPDRHSLSARVILGYGRLSIEGNRARGDWPHRLAGLVSRVPPHCIAGLQSFVDQLPPGSLQTTPRTLVDDLVLLQSADPASVETQMASPMAADPGVFTSITLRVRGVPRTLRSADCPILIGRGNDCTVRVISETASRVHGRIEYVRGKFYYVDDSRNGSWVLTSSGAELQIVKDRIVLAGEGAISPGAPLSQQTGEVLRYTCRSTRLTMPGEGEGDTKPLDRP